MTKVAAVDIGEQSGGLLTPTDAARVLAISEKQLRSLAAAGQIKYINIGLGDKRETRRYDPADLAEFRENRRCLSTKRPGERSTATTSVIVGIDFQARRNARLAGKQSNSKKP